MVRAVFLLKDIHLSLYPAGGVLREGTLKALALCNRSRCWQCSNHFAIVHNMCRIGRNSTFITCELVINILSQPSGILKVYEGRFLPLEGSASSVKKKKR